MVPGREGWDRIHRALFRFPSGEGEGKRDHLFSAPQGRLHPSSIGQRTVLIFVEGGRVRGHVLWETRTNLLSTPSPRAEGLRTGGGSARGGGGI